LYQRIHKGINKSTFSNQTCGIMWLFDSC